MKKLFKSLPVRLLIGVVLGMVIGLIANEAVMNVVVTVKYILGQVITFCVPLIIIGFIAPSITKMGNNASKCWGWHWQSPIFPPSEPRLWLWERDTG